MVKTQEYSSRSECSLKTQFQSFGILHKKKLSGEEEGSIVTSEEIKEQIFTAV